MEIKSFVTVSVTKYNISDINKQLNAIIQAAKILKCIFHNKEMYER